MIVRESDKKPGESTFAFLDRKFSQAENKARISRKPVSITIQSPIRLSLISLVENTLGHKPSSQVLIGQGLYKCKYVISPKKKT